MWTLVLFIGFLSLWFLWRKRKLSLFKIFDIPGPEPSLLFGNYWEILHEGQDVCIGQWIKQYGRVFGYYYGLRPVLIVADPDLLKFIQQKEFHNFANRPHLFEVGSSSTDFDRYSITNAGGKKWKSLRSILTPTFTTSKLKSMATIMNIAVDELIEAVEREASEGKPFDIYHLYQNLTMDVIARTSLGVDTNAQKNKNEPFVKLARIILSLLEMNFLTLLIFSFPEIMGIFSLLRKLQFMWKNQGKHPRGEMMERTYETVKARRRDPNLRRKDVLQSLMDAVTQETVNDSSLTAGENEDSAQNGVAKSEKDVTKKGVKLTDEEILQNTTTFLLAGYETTSTALAFTTHLLCHHQDVQDKVREEIRANLSDDQQVTYDTVSKLQYLDQVLSESLRVYPPILYFVNRKADEDIIIENIKIPKQITVQVPVYNLHHDSAYWDKPEEFNPDRFLPEEKPNRHPMAFQAFGAGPRNCVGMRFAQMEAKMALAKLLNKYKLKPKSGTKKEDLAISKTVIIMRPKQGVNVDIEKV